ncbi:uncharacterized protein LOC127255832 [Andrographis paniculata]|uniref:uncharacterized protein LOC127255832 n=1 Tax=Andrographis paniculata TaxID=175694 RepID=UPI0021E7BE1A|nr:uncharacterized protein LOC127255832 [Andrographis paniculata]
MNNDWYKLQLFSMSLTGPAFSWYTSLPPNSIRTWADMERAFHERFYSPLPEVTISDLTNLRQRGDEFVKQFLERFRRSETRCQVRIPEYQVVNMAIENMTHQLRDKLTLQEYHEFRQLTSKAVKAEQLVREAQEVHNQKFQGANHCVFAQKEAANEDKEQEKTFLAEITQGKPYTWPSLKPPRRKDTNPKISYPFDITKTEQIFEHLLKDNQLHLKKGHKMPTEEELNGKSFCKWHGLYGHQIGNCIAF